LADPEQKVESTSEALRKRVESVLEMAASTVKPLSLTFMGEGLDRVKAETVVQA
jgi:cleavage and polyadenylation specificity factor subunit 3